MLAFLLLVANFELLIDPKYLFLEYIFCFIKSKNVIYKTDTEYNILLYFPLYMYGGWFVGGWMAWSGLFCSLTFFTFIFFLYGRMWLVVGEVFIELFMLGA